MSRDLMEVFTTLISVFDRIEWIFPSVPKPFVQLYVTSEISITLYTYFVVHCYVCAIDISRTDGILESCVICPEISTVQHLPCTILRLSVIPIIRARVFTSAKPVSATLVVVKYLFCPLVVQYSMMEY